MRNVEASDAAVVVALQAGDGKQDHSAVRAPALREGDLCSVAANPQRGPAVVDELEAAAVSGPVALGLDVFAEPAGRFLFGPRRGRESPSQSPDRRPP